MTITFEVHGENGLFSYPAGHDDIQQQFDDLLDEHDAGKLSQTGYVGRLKELLAADPDFIDGHAHLGHALFDQGKCKLALQACQRGVQVGEGVIPPGFDGLIEWGYLKNRPFLRAMHGVVLSLLRLGQRLKALPLMQQMLVWNPDDNQGIRYLIGLEYLRAGKIGEAHIRLLASADDYPPCQYDLALLHFRQGKYAAAATSLRRGFLANGYVAEILCGYSDPSPIVIWHGSNHAEPELAGDYVSQYGDLWRETPDAIAFLRWLHTHPKVLAERAAYLEGREALLWNHEVKERRVIFMREEAILHGIDDCLSDLIVQPHTDRDGSSAMPWKYAQKLRRF